MTTPQNTPTQNTLFLCPYWTGGEASIGMLLSSVLLWSFTEQHYNLLSCSVISSCLQMHFTLWISLLLNRSGKKSNSNAKLIIDAGTKIQPDKNPWSDDNKSWYVDKCVLGEPRQWENCFSKWSDMHRLSHCSSPLRFTVRTTTIISYSHGLLFLDALK